MFYAFAHTQQKPKQDNAASVDGKAGTSKIIYADSGQSTFIITTGDRNIGYDFQTVETNYRRVYIALHGWGSLKHYFAKYTTTSKTSAGLEGQDRTIKVDLHPFDNPNKTELTIEHSCDDLTLNVATYQTVKYGCCGAEDELAIYDYDKKLIIEGDSKILLGEIPNSPVRMFVAYKKEYKDSTTLGTLYYCYSSSDRYTIKIKPNALSCGSHSPFSPNIFIYSTNPDDKFSEDKNEYSFWSLNDIENKNQVNNLTLKIAYECDEHPNRDTIAIPIINGKPFGKDDRNQIIMYRHK